MSAAEAMRYYHDYHPSPYYNRDGWIIWHQVKSRKPYHLFRGKVPVGRFKTPEDALRETQK